MKYCFTTFAVVLLSAVAFSQTTFPTSNATWVNSYYQFDWGSAPFPNKKLVGQEKFAALLQDTIVNQLTYHQVYKNDSLYYGAIREENGKVFFIPTDSIQDYLLYDFNVNQGDLVEQVYFVDLVGHGLLTDLEVSYTDSLMVDGSMRKRIFFDGGSWIEGVGCDFGLFRETYNNVSNYELALDCMSIGEFTTYPEAGNTPCATVSSIGEMTKADFLVYPNPANESLFIESITLRENQQVKIFNQLGKLVLNSELKNGSVDISNLPAGLYFIELEHQEGNRVKFMKE